MDSEEGSVRLSPREQTRGMVLNQPLAGTLSSEQAAVLLGVSIRQLRRLKSRYQADGPGGLEHGNRGRLNRLVQIVNMRQLLGNEEALVGSESAGQRPLELRDLLAHAPTSKLGDSRRIGAPGHQAFQHLSR